MTEAREITARRRSSCQYCGDGIAPGMRIARATFNVREASRRGYSDRKVTQYVHAQPCARHARTEWPELNR